MIEMLLKERFLRDDSRHVYEEGRYLTSIVVVQAHIYVGGQIIAYRTPVFNSAAAR